jgi:hypothetical protein
MSVVCHVAVCAKANGSGWHCKQLAVLGSSRCAKHQDPRAAGSSGKNTPPTPPVRATNKTTTKPKTNPPRKKTGNKVTATPPTNADLRPRVVIKKRVTRRRSLTVSPLLLRFTKTRRRTPFSIDDLPAPQQPPAPHVVQAHRVVPAPSVVHLPAPPAPAVADIVSLESRMVRMETMLLANNHVHEHQPVRHVPCGCEACTWGACSNKYARLTHPSTHPMHNTQFMQSAHRQLPYFFGN